MEIKVLEQYILEAVVNQANVEKLLFFDPETSAKLYDMIFTGRVKIGVLEKINRLSYTVTLAYDVIKCVLSSELYGRNNTLEIPFVFNPKLPMVPYFTEATAGDKNFHYFGPLRVLGSGVDALKIYMPPSTQKRDWELFHLTLTRGLPFTSIEIILKNWN